MTRRDGDSARRRGPLGWPAGRFDHAVLPLRVVAATAWPGFVVGHMLAFGSPHGPGTAHGTVDVHLLELGLLGQLLTGLAGLLVTGVLLLSARHALRSDDRLPLRTTVLAAAAVQVSLFGLIEVAERGWAVAAALSDPAVATGLAVQAVVAAVAVAGLT
ncbi:MAG TPA: hypothetical protein VGR21_05645, partial [Cryptosporangiaceae bacterium]|nr:hypothetical protein [Cryptosporangiaceae bacterium]